MKLLLERVKAYFTEADYEVVGIDVSRWQGTMDWSIAATKINFAILRAGAGNGYYDEQLPANIRGCNDYDIPYGMYWFVKPSLSWQKHAANFAELYLEAPGNLPPVMDIEATYGVDKSGMDAFCSKLCREFENITGVSPMIYTSPGFWNSNLPRTDWAKAHKLWIAHWTSASAPALPYDWGAINNPKEWEFWQHSAKGPGAEYGAQSRSIDLNRYRWDYATFADTYGVDVPPVPPPPPPIPPTPPGSGLLMEVVQDGLRIRTGPGTEYTQIGVLEQGGVIRPTDIGGNSAWVEFEFAGGNAWANVQYGDDRNMEVYDE